MKAAPPYQSFQMKIPAPGVPSTPPLGLPTEWLWLYDVNEALQKTCGRQSLALQNQNNEITQLKKALHTALLAISNPGNRVLVEEAISTLSPYFPSPPA